MKSLFISLFVLAFSTTTLATGSIECTSLDPELHFTVVATVNNENVLINAQINLNGANLDRSNIATYSFDNSQLNMKIFKAYQAEGFLSSQALYIKVNKKMGEVRAQGSFVYQTYVSSSEGRPYPTVYQYPGIVECIFE